MLGIIGLGGICHDTPKLRSMIMDPYYAVAADSGLHHFKMLEIHPDILVGDFDSISASLMEEAKKENIKISQYDARKDFTDSEIAVEEAISHGCERLMFIGAFGTRLDHMLSNQMMAATIASKGIPVIMTDGITWFYSITSENSPFIYPIQTLNAHEDVLSIIPIIGDAKSVKLDGLEYPLISETVLLGSTRAVSNTVPSRENRVMDYATVQVDSGVSFFIHTKSDEFLKN